VCWPTDCLADGVDYRERIGGSSDVVDTDTPGTGLCCQDSGGDRCGVALRSGPSLALEGENRVIEKPLPRGADHDREPERHDRAQADPERQIVVSMLREPETRIQE
jgi:hypothetical protein